MFLKITVIKFWGNPREAHVMEFVFNNADFLPRVFS